MVNMMLSPPEEAAEACLASGKRLLPDPGGGSAEARLVCKRSDGT